MYILASTKDWVLYTWVTSDLIKKIYEHKEWTYKSFTKKYFIDRLVYYEEYWDIMNAIEREKQIKDGQDKKDKSIWEW